MRFEGVFGLYVELASLGFIPLDDVCPARGVCDLDPFGLGGRFWGGFVGHDFFGWCGVFFLEFLGGRGERKMFNYFS